MSIFSVNSASFDNVDISGSLLLSGKKIENVISSTTKYGLVKYADSSPDETDLNAWNTWKGYFYFTFNSGSWWTGSKTTRVQIPYVNYPTLKIENTEYPNNPWILGDGGTQSQWDDFTNYYYKLESFFNKTSDIKNTIITFTSVDYPGTVKKFRIKDLKFYTPLFSGSSFSQNVPWYLQSKTLLSEPVLQTYPFLPNNVQVIDDMAFSELKYNIVSSNENTPIGDLDFSKIFLIGGTGNAGLNGYIDPIEGQLRTSILFSQYDLEVEEVFSSYDTNDPAFFPSPMTIPLQETFFHIDFEDVNITKRKVIHFVTSSMDITIPDWTEKITTICVGAGGGGGGGASGFIHSSSISYEQKIRDGFDDVDGTFGSFTPGLNKNFGHEFVTGGGGGAGGNIAKEILDGNFVIDNRGKKLNITIGLPGKGGLGSSYFNDVVATQTKMNNNKTENDRWKVLLNTDYLFKADMGNLSWPIFPKNYNSINAFHPDATFYPLYSSVTSISPIGNEYNGKPGGDTSISLDRSYTFVIATGGAGGTSGLSIRDSAEAFHLFCGSTEHIPSLVMVPGGANNLYQSMGSEVRLGGPGGYGISMPAPKQTILTKTPAFKTDPYIDELWEHTLFANKAIDIPWKKNNLLGDDNANNIFPIGNTVKGNLTISDMYLKYNSNGELPDLPAPTGGGGGCGASFTGLDRRNASIYSTQIQKHGGPLSRFFNIPDDWFEKMADLITGSIELGLGGSNTLTEYLINDTDENGVLYQYELNSTGSHGGYGFYGIETDNKLSPNGVIYTNIQPQSGVDFGYGGGGGAGRYVLDHNDKFRTDDENLYPTKGQDGADGGRGLAIIIFE
jgi:hypothetical protein